MKKSHRRPIAVFMSAVVSLSAFGGWFTASAADTEEKKEVKLIYEIEEGVTANKTTDLSLFETTTTTEGHTNIPEGYFYKEGYDFSGWTYDDVIGFKSGQFVDIPDDVDELRFHICWTSSEDEKHTVKYVLERDGMTFENPDFLKDESYRPNQVFNPNDTTVFIEEETENGTLKYISKWLTDGERVYSYGTKLVMPDHDLILYPILYKKIQLTYFAGDVDRLNGNDTYSYEKMEGTTDELANKERFSRSGFNLVGWTSSYDGKQYKLNETVLMPGEDVTYTAVWQPIEYKVVFIPGKGGENIKVPTLTDNYLTCPDPGITVDGMHFAGWKASDGTIYQVGDQYKVLGAKPGMGISFSAIWEDGDAPEGTTATSSATTTATTTTSTVTTATGTSATFSPEDMIYGDANCDKKVSVADSVAILQSIGNKDKYKLSALGERNADVDGEAGITAKDALAIQQYDAKLITAFPVEK